MRCCCGVGVGIYRGVGHLASNAIPSVLSAHLSTVELQHTHPIMLVMYRTHISIEIDGSRRSHID